MAGVLVTAAAACAYQPAAMAFWLVWLLWMLSPDGQGRAWREVGRVTAHFLTVMAFASLIALVVQRAGARATHLSGDRASLVGNVPAKLWHVLVDVWPRVANPWSLPPAFPVAIATALLVLAGLLAAPGLPWPRRLVRAGAVLAVLVLGYAPNIATSEDWISSRSMMAIMPVLPISLVAIAESLVDRLRLSASLLSAVAAAAALLLTAWVASFVYENVVVAQESELEAARAAILEATTAPSLTVLPSVWTESFARVVDHDEFGLPSTSKEWVLVPMVELVYREAHGRWYGQAHARGRGDPSPVTDAAVLDFAVLFDRRR